MAKILISLLLCTSAVGILKFVSVNISGDYDFRFTCIHTFFSFVTVGFFNIFFVLLEMEMLFHIVVMCGLLILWWPFIIGYNLKIYIRNQNIKNLFLYYIRQIVYLIAFNIGSLVITYFVLFVHDLLSASDKLLDSRYLSFACLSLWTFCVFFLLISYAFLPKKVS